jgi:hypothetical protein
MLWRKLPICEWSAGILARKARAARSKTFSRFALMRVAGVKGLGS